jgi:magnesium chelatase family protein
LDRIDIHVEVPSIPQGVLRNSHGENGETSAQVRARVEASRASQLQRSGKGNAYLNNREVEQVCKLSEPDYQLLEQAISKFGLSARAYHRILKVARTIADLANSESIQTNHLTEALGYRKLDRAMN